MTFVFNKEDYNIINQYVDLSEINTKLDTSDPNRIKLSVNDSDIILFQVIISESLAIYGIDMTTYDINSLGEKIDSLYDDILQQIDNS